MSWAPRTTKVLSKWLLLKVQWEDIPCSLFYYICQLNLMSHAVERKKNTNALISDMQKCLHSLSLYALHITESGSLLVPWNSCFPVLRVGKPSIKFLFGNWPWACWIIRQLFLPLFFDLPSCQGLPDSLVPGQFTSFSECAEDEEEVAHKSREDLLQLISIWIS